MTSILLGEDLVPRYSEAARCCRCLLIRLPGLGSSPKRSTCLGGLICSLSSSPVTPPAPSRRITYVLLIRRGDWTKERRLNVGGQNRPPKKILPESNDSVNFWLELSDSIGP
ncbi:hypothetical protein LINPERPRIM_LOCUS37882 [Linum perenne]